MRRGGLLKFIRDRAGLVHLLATRTRFGLLYVAWQTFSILGSEAFNCSLGILSKDLLGNDPCPYTLAPTPLKAAVSNDPFLNT
jgi:hypothetical protein